MEVFQVDLSSKLHTAIPESGLMDPQGCMLHYTLKKMLHVYFLKYYPSASRVYVRSRGETPYAQQQDERLIRNYLWQRRHDIFQNNDVVAPVLFSHMLKKYSEIVPTTYLNWSELALRYLRGVEGIHPQFVNYVTEKIHQHFVACLYFLIAEVGMDTYSKMKGAVAKFTFMRELSDCMVELTEKFETSPNEFRRISRKVVDLIKAEATRKVPVLKNQALRGNSLSQTVSGLGNTSLLKAVPKQVFEESISARLDWGVYDLFKDPDPAEVDFEFIVHHRIVVA